MAEENNNTQQEQQETTQSFCDEYVRKWQEDYEAKRKAHEAHNFEDFTPRKGFRCAEYLQKF